VISALPIVPSVGCSAIPGLSAVCGAAGGIGSSILGAGAGDVLGAIAGGVAQGASWLLNQIGTVMTTTTSIDLGASWFKTHYEVTVGLAAIVLVPLLLASMIQAIYHQSPSALLRAALVHLPLALLLGAIAVQLVQLALAATDALCAAVSTTSSSDAGSALSSLASALANQAASGNPGTPTFVVLLGGLFVCFGALLLWVELLVRSAAVYVATLFFPLAMASLVWPAVSQWCRRLVETVAALVLSKFVIVAVLSLAIGALGTSDGSIASELAGGALLLLAGFAPFTLLRLVPMVEAGAAQQLEGARHRVQQAALAGPRTAASFALGQGAAPLPQLAAGTGMVELADAPGAESAGDGGRGTDSPGAERSGAGVPMWRGVPDPAEIRQVRGSTGADGARPAGTGAGKTGRPPIWGAPVPSGTRSRGSQRGGTHVIERDDLGPRLKWHPSGSKATGGPSVDGD
jgi:hypothetical protein